MNTEEMPEEGLDLEKWPTSQITQHIIDSQMRAVEVVRDNSVSISLAAEAMVHCLQTQHSRLVYAGAGSSGALLANDASELLPTFGWPTDRLLMLQAEDSNAYLTVNSKDEDNRQRAIRPSGNSSAQLSGCSASGGCQWSDSIYSTTCRICW